MKETADSQLNSIERLPSALSSAEVASNGRALGTFSMTFVPPASAPSAPTNHKVQQTRYILQNIYAMSLSLSLALWILYSGQTYPHPLQLRSKYSAVLPRE